jgi:nucleoside-diphosphate-sugar epimerase
MTAFWVPRRLVVSPASVMNSQMVLVTGATGFVGRALVQRLVAVNIYPQIAVAVRSGTLRHWPANVLPLVTGDLLPSSDWSDALKGISVVVHCAARVHVMTDASANPLDEFRQVNVQGTLNLARQAAAAGAQRFVFISSIKVNGEATKLGVPFSADDIAAPTDPYGISKMEAEQGLRELSAKTGMEVVIIRPPLVYGLGVKANFYTMMHWLKRGIPLPLGAIHNKRSLVALSNLVDLIVTCIDHPAAANQTFLVSDGEDLSTTQLLQRMGRALGSPARLIPFPSLLIGWVAALMGRPDIAQRLCGSLQVDITKTRHLLGWTPPVSVDQGLKKAAEGYLRETAV